VDAGGPQFEPAGRRFGRYVLLEAIDRGGMAEVYRAVSHGPAGFQRQFVIKRIRKEKAASKDFVDMFINEARISALLEHPNIVQVYDFGQVEGDYFLAMEYLRGRNLLTVGRRVRSMTREVAPDLAGYVAREVARGLHYAHTLTNAGKPLGIVHRDVSPSNIMLLRTGGVKLLDFGIARATMKLRANTPIGGLIKGKLSYLSPEQVRGQKVDGRSDVFSLGVVLWECLTGVRLFYNPNDIETMRNVLHRSIPRPSELRLGLHPSLDDIVMRALDRNLAKRYPDANSMAADLEEYLRECRFSSETLVKLLEELFAEEDSARELPLIDGTPIRPMDGGGAGPGRLGGAPATTGSVPPTAVSSDTDVDGEDNDYATVSSIHKLSSIAARHRRRRLITTAAAAAVVAGAMAVGAMKIPGSGAPSTTATATTPAPAAPVAHVVPAVASPPATPTPAPAPAAAAPAQPAAVVAPAPAPAEQPPVKVEPLPTPAAHEREEAAVADPPAGASRPAARAASPAADPARGKKALARGLSALSSGEYIRAVQELETAAAADPQSPWALRALAEAEFELARYGRALTHARKAAVLAPREAGIRALVGDASFKLQRYRDAAEAYGIAVSLSPGDASLRARLEQAKQKIGSRREAASRN
jgi:serine/threonine protein kinase